MTRAAGARCTHHCAVRKTGAERGESLIELIVTISIIGTCVVGLLAALGAQFTFSAANRVQANADVLLSRYAEALVAVPYESCTTVSTPYAAVAVSAIPSGDLPNGVSAAAPGAVGTSERDFELTVEEVRNWDGATAPAGFNATCPATDPKLQQLVLRVRAGDNSYVQRIYIEKRDAS